MPTRELTPMLERFADAYQGDATRAAEIAGRKGTRTAIAMWGSRALENPLVRARIEARGGKLPPRGKGRPASSRKPQAAKPRRKKPSSPREALMAIMQDAAAHPSAIVRASEALARMDREEASLGVGSLEEYQARLRDRMNACFRERRARERASKKRRARGGSAALRVVEGGEP